MPRRLACLVGSLALAAAAAAADRPNVVLVMADDQGWGDVGYNGHPTLKTPVLDAMAASGLRFDRFYAAAPVCSPTRGSVMTGRHPNRFGCFQWGYTLRPEEITVAEAAKKAGYATGHFGKWHLGSVRKGNPLSPGANGFDEWVSSPNFYENDPLMSHNGTVEQLKGESSMATVEAAVPFMKTAKQADTPFLAVIWFGNPHDPHVPVPELAKEYADQPEGERNYLAEVAGIDRAMGRLRDELTALGVRENTLLWYTSDNGPQDGKTVHGSTGGLRGRKGSLWEGGIRVPGIIEWPAKIPTPRTTAVPCGTVDIYPTVCDLIGVTVPNQPPLDGTSLVPLIEGRTLSRKQPLGFWNYPMKGHSTPSSAWLKKQRGEEVDGRPAPPNDPAQAEPWSKKLPEDDRTGHAALIAGDFKLHRLPGKNGDVTFELYNMASDPNETKDLAASEPDRTTAMRAALEAWQRSVIRSVNGADYK